jgi:hypothetical protein
LCTPSEPPVKRHVTAELINKVRNSLTYKDGWTLRILRSREHVVLGWKFYAPDLTSPSREVKLWSSRDWYLPAYGLTVDKLIKTAWLAAKQAEDHEAAEAFRVNGVAVFDPHKEITL